METPRIKAGEVMWFHEDDTWAVSQCDYWGRDDECHTIARYDSEQELLDDVPESERDRCRTEIDRLKAEWNALPEAEREQHLERYRAAQAEMKAQAERLRLEFEKLDLSDSHRPLIPGLDF